MSKQVPCRKRNLPALTVEGIDMNDGQLAYLILVVAGMAAFAISLALVSRK